MVGIKTVLAVVGGIIAGMVILSVASAFILSKRGGCPLARGNNFKLSRSNTSESEEYL